MCDRCVTSPAPSLSLGSRGRLKLWLVPRDYHCAIIGTCFSHEDMAWMIRRLGLKMSSEAREYDIHRYFVEHAASPGPVSKLMTKRLDEKYAGEIRRFARESTDAGWIALWDAARESGGVAAAFWALVSREDVPSSVKMRAYADVHMLSHLMGGENRRHLREKQELTRRIDDLTGRLARAERAETEKLAERDARIKALEAEVAALRRAAPAPARPALPVIAARPTTRAVREAETLRRRVAAERARARAAEAEAERLRRLLDEPARTASPDTGAVKEGADTDTAVPTDLAGQAILYVGGRPRVLAHMRSTIEARNGRLLYHDGGCEQAARCLEGLVERADVVLCPIDCISHDACLRVKGLCRRMDKPFIPLRSAGASSFARALSTLKPGGGGAVATA